MGPELTPLAKPPLLRRRSCKRIHSSEELAAANQLLETAQTEAGLGSVLPSAVEATATKLQARLKKDEATLVADNKLSKECGVDENLGTRGATLCRDVSAAHEKLVFLEGVSRGWHASDETQLEFSPTYLLRTIEDAQHHIVELPWTALHAAVVTRHSQTLLAEGNVRAAVTVLDPAIDSVCGIRSVKDRRAFPAVQEEVACRLIGEMMANEEQWGEKKHLELLIRQLLPILQKGSPVLHQDLQMMEVPAIVCTLS